MPAIICLIPLVPYGHQVWSPERYWTNATLQTYDFRKSLGETVAKDLRAAGIATTVVYADSDAPTAQSQTKGAYALELVLKDAAWHRYVTLYGVSFMGAFAWLFGAPASYGNVAIELMATMKDPSGRLMAQRTFAGRANAIEWLWLPDVFPEKLPVAYGDLSPGLRRFVLENVAR